MKHITVLKNEAIEYLNVKEDGIYVDMTLGGGGHSEEILKRLTNGHLYAFDKDDYAIGVCQERLKPYMDKVTFIHSDYRKIKEKLEELGVTKVDGVLYDLGVSSFQFDDEQRGFSYNNDAILDMRMDRSQKLDAKYIINNYCKDDLINIFYKYGDESFSKPIANKIVEARKEKEIQTTFELVDIIKSALPQKILNQKGHPAKKVFQALRIEVNDELKAFEYSLNDALSLLNHQGRICVISFQSLEDKICKSIFKDKSTIKYPDKLPIIIKEEAPFKLITKSVILPSEEEIVYNNRAHSAKMRVIERR